MYYKRDIAIRYFKIFPDELDIAQQKEDGKTEKQLGAEFAHRGYNHTAIKRLRKQLMELFEAGGWDEICLQLVIMELIKPRTKLPYIFKEKASQHFIDEVERFESLPEEQQKKKKDKDWNKRKKELGWA